MFGYTGKRALTTDGGRSRFAGRVLERAGDARPGGRGHRGRGFAVERGAAAGDAARPRHGQHLQGILTCVLTYVVLASV